MTKDEALRLALEALEDIGDEWGFTSQRTVPKRKEAIIAIKEALAQPEQDGECKYCTDGCPACDARKLPEQKPFAWYDPTNGAVSTDKDSPLFTPLGQVLPLYSQRTWVGLTKEERHEISMANRPYCADIMAAHEEELKRRNA